MPVRLALARARPEIVAMNDERLFFFVAEFVDDRDAAFLPGNNQQRCILHRALLSAVSLYSFSLSLTRAGSPRALALPSSPEQPRERALPQSSARFALRKRVQLSPRPHPVTGPRQSE